MKLWCPAVLGNDSKLLHLQFSSLNMNKSIWTVRSFLVFFLPVWLSLWASHHALAGHMRSCSSTDIMYPGLEFSQQWGHGARYHSHSFSLSAFLFLITVLSINLSFTLFSPLSLSLLSLHSYSSSLLSIYFPAWKKALACCLFSSPILPTLPPINAWMVFYVKLTLIRVISAPSSFYLPLNPVSSPLAPLPEISVSCRQNKRSEGE